MINDKGKLPVTRLLCRLNTEGNVRSVLHRFRLSLQYDNGFTMEDANRVIMCELTMWMNLDKTRKTDLLQVYDRLEVLRQALELNLNSFYEWYKDMVDKEWDHVVHEMRVEIMKELNAGKTDTTEYPRVF